MDKASCSKDGNKEEQNILSRTPQAVISRRIQLYKMREMQKASRTEAVRPLKSSESPANPEKCDQQTVPVSLPIIHYHETEANKHVSPLNQNSSTLETRNMHFNWGQNVSPSESDTSPIAKANSYDDKQKELARKTSDHGINPNSQMTISHGTQEQNKNITKDHGNVSGYYPSNETRMTFNQQQRGEIPQLAPKTADRLRTSISTSEVELLLQFNNAVNDTASIGEELSNQLRNVRKGYPHVSPTPIKHNLPVETMPARQRYNLFNTPNAPVAPPSENPVNTANNGGLKLKKQGLFPQNINNKQSLSTITGNNQSTHKENVKIDVSTQTEPLHKEQNIMLDFIRSNDITLEELKMVIESRTNYAEKPAVENLNDEARTKSNVVEIVNSDDEENKVKSIDFTMYNEIINLSNKNKLLYKEYIKTMSGHDKKDALETVVDELKTTLNSIIERLNHICIYLCTCVEHALARQKQESANSEAEMNRKRPYDANGKPVAEPEPSISASNNLGTGQKTKQHRISKNPRAPVRHRAPIAEDTRQQWNSQPNLNQHLQQRQYASRHHWPVPQTASAYQQTPQASAIQPYNEAPVWNKQYRFPIPVPPEATLANTQHLGFSNQHAANIGMVDQQQYTEAERYQQFQLQKRFWEARTGNYAGHTSYDHEMYNAGN